MDENAFPDFTQMMPLIMGIMTGDENAKEAIAETGRQFARGFEEEAKAMFAEVMEPIRGDINLILTTLGLPITTEG